MPNNQRIPLASTLNRTSAARCGIHDSVAAQQLSYQQESDENKTRTTVLVLTTATTTAKPNLKCNESISQCRIRTGMRRPGWANEIRRRIQALTQNV